jgi:hypothetical protein
MFNRIRIAGQTWQSRGQPGLVVRICCRCAMSGFSGASEQVDNIAVRCFIETIMLAMFSWLTQRNSEFACFNKTSHSDVFALLGDDRNSSWRGANSSVHPNVPPSRAHFDAWNTKTGFHPSGSYFRSVSCTSYHLEIDWCDVPAKEQGRESTIPFSRLFLKTKYDFG